jgi:hypothetical protein
LGEIHLCDMERKDMKITIDLTDEEIRRMKTILRIYREIGVKTSQFTVFNKLLKQAKAKRRKTK